MHRLVQIPFKEERLGAKEEEGDAEGVDQSDGPEGGGIVEELRDDATQQDAETHADVPRDEDGAVGSTPLTVLRHVDGHILEGGPHVTVAQADEKRRDIIANHVWH